MREIIKLVVVLSLICGISAGALTLVRVTLDERIETQNDLNIRGPALEQLFNQPAAELLRNKVKLIVDEITYPVFYRLENGVVTGLAVEAAGSGGYGGDITVMLGIDMEKDEIIGLEIIMHNETPGVGSQVEEVNFRTQWNKLSLNNSIDLRSGGGTIDGISGATYSSKAVVAGSEQVRGIVRNENSRITALIEAQLKQRN